jgi:prevent-host-death family protein
MTTTTIFKFRREFDAFRRYARCEPVEITRHGRRAFVLMSAEHYDWIRAASRRAHRTSNATTVVINAVERAELDPEHAALDELLK